MTQLAPSYLDHLDREVGDGSNEAEEDAAEGGSIFDNPWGSTAATTFNPQDSDGYDRSLPKEQREQLERLADIHHGKGEPSRKHDINQSNIRNDARTFTSVLEMPEPERETVMEILDELDLASREWGGVPYEKIILAVCSLVSDEALSRRIRDAPAENSHKVEERLFLTREFRELMDATGMSSADHRDLRTRVRNRSDYF